jgi:predicted ATPase
MAANADRFFVLTGGPGSGKTTLIDELATLGYARTIEAGRAIIQDQMAAGGNALPWVDPTAFADLMLSWEMRSYAQARRDAGPVFFDRGLPDVAGYLRLSGLDVPVHVEKAARELRYHPRVFVAPPWPAIFHGDAERRQDFAEAERTYQAVTTAYRRFGYQLVELPLAPVADRVRFVLDRVVLT